VQQSQAAEAALRRYPNEHWSGKRGDAAGFEDGPRPLPCNPAGTILALLSMPWRLVENPYASVEFWFRCFAKGST